MAIFLRITILVVELMKQRTPRKPRTLEEAAEALEAAVLALDAAKALGTLEALEDAMEAARAAKRAARATGDLEAKRLAMNAYNNAYRRLPRVKEYQAAYQRNNRETIYTQQAKYMSKPGVKEVRVAQQLEYSSRPEVKERVNTYLRERRVTDPDFRLICRLRSRQCQVLKGNSKSAPTMTQLGCTPAEANAYIALKFTAGMSWDNYGEWEYDHIVPLASFDLTDPKQQDIAFHYTNLQPLWKADNRTKSAKLDWNNPLTTGLTQAPTGESYDRSQSRQLGRSRDTHPS